MNTLPKRKLPVHRILSGWMDAGLSISALYLLTYIGERGPGTIADIGRGVRVKDSQVYKLTLQLKAAKLIIDGDGVISANNRRVSTYKLSEQGTRTFYSFTGKEAFNA